MNSKTANISFICFITRNYSAENVMQQRSATKLNTVAISLQRGIGRIQQKCSGPFKLSSILSSC